MGKQNCVVALGTQHLLGVNWRFKRYHPLALQTIPYLRLMSLMVSFDDLIIGFGPGWRFGIV